MSGAYRHWMTRRQRGIHEPARPRILTINGGSSRIDTAVFEGDEPLQQILHGGVERISLPGGYVGPGRALRGG